MSKVGKKYEVVEIDGRKVEIRVSPHAADGPFFAYVEGKHYQGPDVEVLKKEIWKDIAASYEKAPVIAITLPEKHGHFDRGEIFGLKIERFYMGEHPFKGRLFFQFAPKDDSFLYAEDVEGECGYATHGPSTWSRDLVRVIPYTPAKWVALQRIKAQYVEMKNRIEELLSGEDAERVIESVSMKLIEGPKSNKESE